MAETQILVTGSARLDLYGYGGDSLQGRSHYLRLLPLSLNEIKGTTSQDLRLLLQSEIEKPNADLGNIKPDA
jgi:predicted AAA+ superfamily ATPase